MPSCNKPSRKNLFELKRPNLKGKFDCVSCGRTFNHAASLRNHRLRFHSTEQTCLICNQTLNALETIREHLEHHGISQKVYTCACCNWTFHSRKYFLGHMKAIRTTGQPGEFQPVSVSCHAPGALLQPIHGKHSDSSSSSRSSSPPSDENTMDDITEEVPGTTKSLTLADLSECLISSESLGKNFSDAIAKLSAVKIEAPHIDCYEDAITYVFNKIKFTNKQVTNPIVWHHIIETAVYLNSK